MNRNHQDSLLILLLILLFLFPVTALMARGDFTLSDRIAARIAGPFLLRFIFQPLFAMILGIRDGRTDARLGTPPYILEIITHKENRIINIKKGIQAILTPFVIGIMLDFIVQFNLFHTVHILGGFLVGGLLVGIPYALTRGISNRLKRKARTN